MADEPKKRKAHPIARGFGALACLLFIALGILFFPVPLSGLAEKPWFVTIPLTCLLAVIYFGKLALTGRAPW